MGQAVQSGCGGCCRSGAEDELSRTDAALVIPERVISKNRESILIKQLALLEEEMLEAERSGHCPEELKERVRQLEAELQFGLSSLEVQKQRVDMISERLGVLGFEPEPGRFEPEPEAPRTVDAGPGRISVQMAWQPGKGEEAGGPSNGLQAEEEEPLECGAWRPRGLKDTEGAYLVFSAHDHGGTLSLLWSKADVPGALAFFKSGTPVPGHKFKVGSAKMPLATKTGTADKGNPLSFRTGWASFLKEGAKAKGTLTVFPNTDEKTMVKVVLLDHSFIVRHVPPGVPFRFEDIIAGAIVHRDDHSFDIFKAPQERFADMAFKAGAYIALETGNAARAAS